MVNNKKFHSHLEFMESIRGEDIPKQVNILKFKWVFLVFKNFISQKISLSYDLTKGNTISVNKFNETYDATR